jgi:hypothetical protein
MASLIANNKVDMLYGGRHGKYKKILDNLFQRLSAVAQLVFFMKGPVMLMPDKLDTWRERQLHKHKLWNEVQRQISEEVSIEDIVNTMWELPKFSPHSELVQNRAKAYGKVIIALTDTELVQYACNNPNVIAVLGQDSDFLIFGGDWRYFSAYEINFETLTTMEFSRTALKNHLSLSDQQMIVLSTIAGNNIIRYDEVRHCHQHNFGHNAEVKFPAIAEFIRQHIDLENSNSMVAQLAGFLLRDQSLHAMDQIRKSIDLYDIVS